MAGNLSGLHVFTADVGPEPLSLLDGNFSPIVTALNNLNNFSNYYVDAGGVNALSITVPGTQSVSYAAGLTLTILVAASNTSAFPTLNVNGLGAQTIVDPDNTSLLAGALVGGLLYTFVYNGTNFALQNPTYARGRGIAQTRSKPAVTSRASTVVLSNDPDLVIAVPGAGVFALLAVLKFSENGASAGGFAMNFNYSGTFTTGVSRMGANYNANGLAGGMAINVIQSVVTSLSISISTVSNSPQGTPLDYMFATGSLVATGAGNVAVAWAQASNNASATFVDAGSYFTVTPM